MFNELILADAVSSSSTSCVNVWILCALLVLCIVGLIIYIIYQTIIHKEATRDCVKRIDEEKRKHL